MKNGLSKFINKKNFFYRVQQFIILILHLVLLKWMYYTLTNSGSLSTEHVLYHFLGMSIYGALLIRGCAWWAQNLYLKENNLKSLDGKS
ncbi:MAG: hypothetical protein L6Q33_08045 [Bacteriovoracaceae bacterium]|nr:hypothetical protein [Bacteriovoracaceae bacterium]